MFAAVDSTGQISEEDLDKYDTALLITDDGFFLHDSRNSPKSYGTLNTLDSFPTSMEDLLDYDFTLGLTEITKPINRIAIMSGVLNGIFRPILSYIWNAFVITCFAVLIWGVFRLFTKGITTNMVITIGIFTYLPALVIDHLMVISGNGITFFKQIIHVIIWMSLLVRLLKFQRNEIQLLEPKIKTSLYGIPAALFIALNAIFDWEFVPPFIIAGTLLTLCLLNFLEYKDNQEFQATK